MIHFEETKKLKVSTLLKTHHFKSLGLIKVLCLLLGLILSGCSEQQQAGGTASEGENYVYGTVLDTAGDALVQAQVYLKQVSIYQDTVVEVDIDSTLTDSEGYYEFYPELEDTLQLIIQSQLEDLGLEIVSRVIWKGPRGGSQEVPPSRLAPPVKVRGSFLGYEECGSEQIEIIIPGTPIRVPVAPDGGWGLPPIPGGRSEMAVLCGESVQYIPLDLPPGCKEIELFNIPITRPSEIDSSEFKPYPTDFKHSGYMGAPPAPDRTSCPGAEVGPGLMPPK